MTTIFGTASSREVIRTLEQAGYEAVFVGGAVRDYVLGKLATDMDIATSAEPDEVKAVFSTTFDVGIAHGTVLVLMHREPIEVTTYRTEGTYSDNRRPDEVQFVKSLREDLQRRDFTMNALAMTIDGELIDPFGGRNDLAQRVIRAVGNPEDRFKEDALRMFRAIRFTAVLDFMIEPQTFEAIRNHAGRLRHISVERLKAEMDKLLIGVNPKAAFTAMQQTGLGSHLPLFPHDIDGLGRTVPFESILEGWACFMISGDFSPAAVAKAYKLSNVEKKFLMEVHALYVKRKVQDYIVDDYYHYASDVFQTVEKLRDALDEASDTLTSTEIEQQQQALPIQSKEELVVTGKDLIAWSGLAGGRWTGTWMKEIEQAVLHGLCNNDPNDIKDWFSREYKREK